MNKMVRLRFHRGDVDAFADLAEAVQDDLYTLCLRLTGSAAEADDLMQDALIRALRKCDRYDPERPFRPWLLRLTVNLWRSRLRSPMRVFARALNFSLVSEGPGPEHTTLADERDAKVREVVASLPPAYREALSLFHMDEMSYEEMSEVTGASISALKQRVRRGRQMVREKIEKLYPELALARIKNE